MNIQNSQFSSAQHLNWAKLVECSLEEIYVFDAEYLRFIYVNPAACSNLGYSIDEMRKMTPLDLKPNVDPIDFQNSIIAPLKKGLLQVTNFRTQHRRKDGSLYEVEVRLQMMQRTEHPVFLALILDIGNQLKFERHIHELNLSLEHKVEERTKELREEILRRKQSENDMLAAKEIAIEANQSKSTFLANVSHELRTPLNAIIGFSELMKMDPQHLGLHPTFQEYANSIFNSGKHLLDLINQILDISKIEAGKFELEKKNINLQDLILSLQEISSPLAENRSVNLDFKDVEDREVHVDRLRVLQILLNLVSNAIKFSPKKGQVTFKIKGSPEKGIDFLIHDEGPGISKEDLKDVFEPFFQSDVTMDKNSLGSGLGLTISKKLANLHGGDIFIQSSLDKGTTAILHLPDTIFSTSYHYDI